MPSVVLLKPPIGVAVRTRWRLARTTTVDQVPSGRWLTLTYYRFGPFGYVGPGKWTSEKP